VDGRRRSQELEMVVFNLGELIFGTEASQIISIVVKSEELRGTKGESVLFALDESISLVDLPARLGTKEQARKPAFRGAYAAPAVLLVNTGPYAEADAEAKAAATGVYVDSLRGVVKMPSEQIEPLPEFLKSRIEAKARDCIWGIGKLDGELVILLDLDRYVMDFSFQLADG
jgi:chemotaxis signal transduction protein